MKTIATINADIPGAENFVSYLSDTSLHDYDIIVFDPVFPDLPRIRFSGGGSSVEIEAGSRLRTAMRHWRSELTAALKSGKTIFVLLNSVEQISIANSYTTQRKGERTYNTVSVNNYDILPIDISVSNGRGKKIKVVEPSFRNLLETLKDIVEYKVIVKSNIESAIFTTKDSTGVVGAICRPVAPGCLVLLPHFDLSDMVEENDGEEMAWTKEALKISTKVVGQLVAIDKALRSKIEETAKPSWVESVKLPIAISSLEQAIASLEIERAKLDEEQKEKTAQKGELQKFQRLLFENGRLLEEVIESSLRVIGYKVAGFRSNDLEIDHVIIGPSGVRMIGESEGKDNSAVDISKFRQLENNISEDFARDEIESPAKGILFGNGYRLTDPENRESEFTQKCMTNAKRLGTALIRTRDLYDVVVYILDHPDDEVFKKKCRDAIEDTIGDVVKFPI